MPNKIMLVTVGTSLFSSASWTAEIESKLGIDKYSRWTQVKPKENPLVRPEIRVWMDGSKLIKDRLNQKIEVNNAKEWSKHIARELDTPMRYSAELATIIRLYDKENRAGDYAGIGGFLNQRYEHIYLLCNENDDDPSRIAAEHLKEYLIVLTDGKLNSKVEVKDKLKTGDLGSKVESIFSYLRKICLSENNDYDIVISGGYKIYVSICGIFIEARWKQGNKNDRIIFLHESDNELIQRTVNSLMIDGAPKEITFSDDEPGSFSDLKS